MYVVGIFKKNFYNKDYCVFMLYHYTYLSTTIENICGIKINTKTIDQNSVFILDTTYIRKQ